MDLNWGELFDRVRAWADENQEDLFRLAEQLEEPEEDLILGALRMGLRQWKADEEL